MTLLESFFDAMVRLDGDTLVMQVGQKPYLVRAASTYRGPVEWGQVELSTKPLTLEGGLAVLSEILPDEQRRALSEFGAVEYEFAPQGAGGECFTAVAARGGDDIWVEIRRRPPPVKDRRAEPSGERFELAEVYLERAPEPLAPIETADDVGGARLVERGPESEASDEPQPAEPEQRPFLLLPLARQAPKVAPPPSPAAGAAPDTARVEQLLRAAIDAGASSLFIVADERPMARVNGEVRDLGAEAVSAADLLKFVERTSARGAMGAPAPDERPWVAELPDIGRVECLAVEDYRGPGLTIHVIPPGLNSADHLNLPEDVQALCDVPDGLVLIASARAGGKSTLVHAFVDVINRTRCDHVVAIESRIGYRHASQHSFISQRETGGDGEKAGAMLRGALREGPDVLVVDDLRGPETVAVAVDAARAGRVVFATIAAASVREAMDRMLDVFVPARRPQVRALLSGILRGAIAQTLVKSVAGPLVPAHEVWLTQPERRTTLQQSLVELVRDGRVHPSEALRAAADRELLAAALQEEGFEAGGERLA